MCWNGLIVAVAAAHCQIWSETPRHTQSWAITKRIRRWIQTLLFNIERAELRWPLDTSLRRLPGHVPLGGGLREDPERAGGTVSPSWGSMERTVQAAASASRLWIRLKKWTYEHFIISFVFWVSHRISCSEFSYTFFFFWHFLFSALWKNEVKKALLWFWGKTKFEKSPLIVLLVHSSPSFRSLKQTLHHHQSEYISSVEVPLLQPDFPETSHRRADCERWRACTPLTGSHKPTCLSHPRLIQFHCHSRGNRVCQHLLLLSQGMKEMGQQQLIVVSLTPWWLNIV